MSRGRLWRSGLLWATLLAGSPAQTQTKETPGDAAWAAMVMMRAGQYDEALLRIAAALRTAPDNARLWTLQGISLASQGKRKDAEVSFERALALHPDDPAALRGEAQITYDNGDPRSETLLQRLIRNSPGDATARQMLGTLQAQRGSCAEAEMQFQGMGEAASTKHPELKAVLGGCLVGSGQPARAVPLFEELAHLHPESGEVVYDLAVALVEAKRVKEALVILQPLIQKGEDAEALSLASEAYEEEGDTPKAVALERQAIVLKPATPAYYVQFASLCLNHDSFQVGIDMVNVGLRNVPPDPALFLARGLLYAQMAQYDAAEADFKQAELLDSKQSISSYAMDIAELQRTHANPDAKTLRDQVRHHPESPYLNYLLGKVLWSDGAGGTAASAEALPFAKRAVELKPNMAEARDLLASLYLATDLNDLAIEQCNAALKADPDDQPAIYHLIVALRHSPDASRRAEIPGLVRRLSELKTRSRQDEIARKRFSLQEGVLPAP